MDLRWLNISRCSHRPFNPKKKQIAVAGNEQILKPTTVGNEQILKAYDETCVHVAGVETDIYESPESNPVPSAGSFRSGFKYVSNCGFF